MSICGLNNAKHKGILDDMIEKGILSLEKEPWGNKMILKYKISEKGIRIMKEVLDPYEELFPREDKK
jgi:predicted transcriptional regulator